MNCSLIAVTAPLVGAIVAGFFRKPLGRVGAHSVTIGLIFISFLCSVKLAFDILSGSESILDTNLYTWASGAEWFSYSFNIGFLIDPLTVMMMVIVTFVSLLVHIYSIGYMHDDDGYQRFFSYISLFTFMMLMLVTANNFLQLFFGWEGVGLVSYLLIGFWYQKESAIQGSLKAFLVNRVGDFGFILGIGLVLAYCGSLHYQEVFNQAAMLSNQTIVLFGSHAWSVITVTAILLFVGAMGKSAQVPLHVWLPESMEGPTPISALIHAATMVTAGVFMVARLSPLYELSNVALSFILVIGATGALFMGILGIVVTDIKRVVAYSTLSQLGYMMVAMGASAYNVGIFHLLTHACFKALLFLGAGSVIIGLHHEQDMRKMGGLWRKMPITYVTFLIGTLALCAIPPFAGFFSKETIIEVTKLSTIPGAKYAYFCVLLGAMVTAIYSFRALFMTFHGTPRMDKDTFDHVHESPWVVWLPLVLLAVPSIGLGYVLFYPMLLKTPTLLGSAIVISPSHPALGEFTREVTSAAEVLLEVPRSLPFWLSMLGLLIAIYGYILKPLWPEKIARHMRWLYRLLLEKYGFDALNDRLFVHGSKTLGSFFSTVGDRLMIDGLIVNGSGRFVQWVALQGKKMQMGYLYHAALIMVLGVFGALCWLLLN